MGHAKEEVTGRQKQLFIPAAQLLCRQLGVKEPHRCSGFIPIEMVYSLDPAPDSISVEARSHILGVQANLWTEYMTNEEMVEYQALPRMSALSEVQWTAPSQKDFDGFKDRLSRFTQLLDRYHYRYCKHLWPERQIPNRWQF